MPDLTTAPEQPIPWRGGDELDPATEWEYRFIEQADYDG